MAKKREPSPDELDTPAVLEAIAIFKRKSNLNPYAKEFYPASRKKCVLKERLLKNYALYDPNDDDNNTVPPNVQVIEIQENVGKIAGLKTYQNPMKLYREVKDMCGDQPSMRYNKDLMLNDLHNIYRSNFTELDGHQATAAGDEDDEKTELLRIYVNQTNEQVTVEFINGYSAVVNTKVHEVNEVSGSPIIAEKLSDPSDIAPSLLFTPAAQLFSKLATFFEGKTASDNKVASGEQLNQSQQVQQHQRWKQEREQQQQQQQQLLHDEFMQAKQQVHHQRQQRLQQRQQQRIPQYRSKQLGEQSHKQELLSETNDDECIINSDYDVVIKGEIQGILKQLCKKLGVDNKMKPLQQNLPAASQAPVPLPLPLPSLSPSASASPSPPPKSPPRVIQEKCPQAFYDGSYLSFVNEMRQDVERISMHINRMNESQINILPMTDVNSEVDVIAPPSTPTEARSKTEITHASNNLATGQMIDAHIVLQTIGAPSSAAAAATAIAAGAGAGIGAATGTATATVVGVGIGTGPGIGVTRGAIRKTGRGAFDTSSKRDTTKSNNTSPVAGSYHFRDTIDRHRGLATNLIANAGTAATPTTSTFNANNRRGEMKKPEMDNAAARRNLAKGSVSLSRCVLMKTAAAAHLRESQSKDTTKVVNSKERQPFVASKERIKSRVSFTKQNQVVENTTAGLGDNNKSANSSSSKINNSPSGRSGYRFAAESKKPLVGMKKS